MVAHIFEWIISHVAEQFHARLHTPIPLVIVHQGLTEEEPRLESTHVPVAGRIAVYDLLFRHFLSHLPGLILVNEVGERPVFFGDLAVMGLARNEGGGNLLKGFIEWLIVKKNPIIAIIPIKSIFNMSNRFDNFPQIRISC